ncbi:hypothetical protein AMTR_s00073p00038110 [Amborella trichopoda]|uniref:Uncharacterized protein n=1 Tax=Amborella trichopoda TaxID=13333 RepID=W1NRH8_AMBTC|nr:hypothetical protein AMTR_s00073p00038110 [Amborella trichopoda]
MPHVYFQLPCVTYAMHVQAAVCVNLAQSTIVCDPFILAIGSVHRRECEAIASVRLLRMSPSSVSNLCVSNIVAHVTRVKNFTRATCQCRYCASTLVPLTRAGRNRLNLVALQFIFPLAKKPLVFTTKPLETTRKLLKALVNPRAITGNAPKSRKFLSLLSLGVHINSLKTSLEVVSGSPNLIKRHYLRPLVPLFSSLEPAYSVRTRLLDEKIFLAFYYLLKMNEGKDVKKGYLSFITGHPLLRRKRLEPVCRFKKRPRAFLKRSRYAREAKKQ